jgi:hypothetical protein
MLLLCVEPEWRFTVLSLHLLDTEILERMWACESSKVDWCALVSCALKLAKHDMLGNKTPTYEGAAG